MKGVRFMYVIGAILQPMAAILAANRCRFKQCLRQLFELRLQGFKARLDLPDLVEEPFSDGSLSVQGRLQETFLTDFLPEAFHLHVLRVIGALVLRELARALEGCLSVDELLERL